MACCVPLRPIVNLLYEITPVATDMTKFQPSESNSAVAKANAILTHSIQNTPLKRIAEVEDISNLVSFLVSRDSDCA